MLNTRLGYEYNTLCILNYTDEDLGNSNNPFALILPAAKKALVKGKNVDDKLLEGRLFIFRKLYENDIFEKRKLQAILTFLDNYVRFKNPKYNRKFRIGIDTITDKKNTMDIFEQVAEVKRQEGVQEGTEKSVRILLATTEFSIAKIASLAQVPVSLVKKLSKEVRSK